MVSHAAKKNVNRRIKEKDPGVGLGTRTHGKCLFAHVPTAPHLIKVPQRPLSPLHPSPITATFRGCRGSSRRPRAPIFCDLFGMALASKRTPARSEGGQLLWTLPGQNSKEKGSKHVRSEKFIFKAKRTRPTVRKIFFTK